jgi:hypothetical protein
MTFYLITNKVNIKDKNNIDNLICYSITNTKKQAEEYIARLLFMQHRNHFLAWCNNRNIIIKDSYYPEHSLWKTYYNLVWPNEKKIYAIQQVKYKSQDMASILRMFNNSIPVGCSFETEEEYKHYEVVNNVSLTKQK